VEVPALRQREGGDKQDGCSDSAERRERDQPHEVLRREHLSEDQEAGDTRGEEEPGLDPASERDQSGRERGDHRQHGARGRQRIGKPARQIARDRRCGAHHGCVVRTNSVGGKEHARTETLRVQRAADL